MEPGPGTAACACALAAAPAENRRRQHGQRNEAPDDSRLHSNLPFDPPGHGLPTLIAERTSSSAPLAHGEEPLLPAVQVHDHGDHDREGEDAEQRDHRAPRAGEPELVAEAHEGRHREQVQRPPDEGREPAGRLGEPLLVGGDEPDHGVGVARQGPVLRVGGRQGLHAVPELAVDLLGPLDRRPPLLDVLDALDPDGHVLPEHLLRSLALGRRQEARVEVRPARGLGLRHHEVAARVEARRGDAEGEGQEEREQSHRAPGQGVDGTLLGLRVGTPPPQAEPAFHGEEPDHGGDDERDPRRRGVQDPDWLHDLEHLEETSCR